MKSIRNRKFDTAAFFFLLPAFLLYTGFVIFPSLRSIELSFTNWDGLSRTYDYIGLRNYVEIFTSKRFGSAFRNTLYLTVMVTILENILALALALAVDRIRWAKGFFRAVFYVPVLISGIVSGFMWITMYNWNFGVLNSILRQLGLGDYAVDWIGDPHNVLNSLILTIVWKGVGYYMIIYLAGLQSISKDYLEAAKIDGASALQSFRHITLPLLSGSITVNMTLSLIGGLKIFDQIAVMTNGGPGFASETITYLIYRTAFGEGRQGFGNALAIVLFLIILIFNAIQSKILRNREVQL